MAGLKPRRTRALGQKAVARYLLFQALRHLLVANPEETSETGIEEKVAKVTKAAEAATAEDSDAAAVVVAVDSHAAVAEAAEEVVAAEAVAEEADRDATRRLSSGFTTPRPCNTNQYL